MSHWHIPVYVVPFKTGKQNIKILSSNTTVLDMQVQLFLIKVIIIIFMHLWDTAQYMSSLISGFTLQEHLKVYDFPHNTTV